MKLRPLCLKEIPGLIQASEVLFCVKYKNDEMFTNY